MENNSLENKRGILIYQLPQESMGKAMRILPRDIKSFFINEFGLHVYFNRKEICDEFIRKKNIDLEGILFYIFSTVTYLTVFGIKTVASEEIVKKYLKNERMSVHKLYQIEERDDYRIILDVPEVLVNIKLNPIPLEGNNNTVLFMEFYCLACHKEGHKQYQCQQSLTEKKDDKGVGSCSKNERNSKQGKFRRTSGSGVRNTILISQGNPCLSARENVASTEAKPSTSSTPTVAESLPRRISNWTTKNKDDVRGRTRHLRSAKNQRTLKNTYPCRDIINIILDTHGTLQPKRLLEFIKEVYHKKNVIYYAKKYTPDIPALITQIRNVIFQYNHGNSRSSLADRDINILEYLCKHLDS